MYFRYFRQIAVAGVMALGVLTSGAGQSRAFVIDGSTSAGDSFDVDFVLNPGDTDNGGNTYNGPSPLMGTVTYTVTSLDLSATGSIGLSIDIANNSDPSVYTNILSIGAFLDPNLTVTSFTAGGTFVDYAQYTNFPTFQTIDLCIFAQNCTGGAFNAGLAPGDTDTVLLTLSGDLSGGMLTIDPTVMKWQGDYGSFEFAGTPPGTPPRVSEPASLALFGSGLLGLGFLNRRRRRTA